MANFSAQLRCLCVSKFSAHNKVFGGCGIALFVKLIVPNHLHVESGGVLSKVTVHVTGKLTKLDALKAGFNAQSSYNKHPNA